MAGPNRWCLIRQMWMLVLYGGDIYNGVYAVAGDAEGAFASLQVSGVVIF